MLILELVKLLTGFIFIILILDDITGGCTMKEFFKKLRIVLIAIGSTLLTIGFFVLFIFIKMRTKKTEKGGIDEGNADHISDDDIFTSFNKWRGKKRG